jgi:hypothetical protein
MGIYTLDFETYYSREYSLSKMTPAAYLFDPRFELICCSIRAPDGTMTCPVGHAAIERELRAIDWTKHSMLAHNNAFDGAILAWIFDLHPALYLCTLSMARALTHAHKGKSSLKAVAEYLGFTPKGTAVQDALGKRLNDFTPQELADYIAYCIHDNELAFDIFKRFMRVFPKKELLVIDQTIRMYVEPAVTLNQHKLALHLATQTAIKEAQLARVVHIDKSIFSSNTKFAALLESMGVDVPMKVSKTTGLLMPALAKNDRAFKEMCDDADQPVEVQAILAARVGVKSTIEVTRTARLMGMAQQCWPAGWGDCWLPVPLNYHAAHTSRFGGAGGINLQNLQRMSMLRDAIEAPPGFRIVHRDSSQIEARMVSWLAKAFALLNAFHNKIDVYSQFATGFYGRTITKANTGERFVGKTATLGLGYGCGANKFRHMLFIGLGGVSVKVDEEEAKRVVNYYRNDYGKEVPALWRFLDGVLQTMASMSFPAGAGQRGWHYSMGGQQDHWLHSLLDFTAEAVFFPDGLAIQYPKLRGHEYIDGVTNKRRTQIVYNDPYGSAKPLWGGSFLENISQKLARIVITDAMCRVRHETGYHPFMTTHDSLDYVVPESDAQWWDDYLGKQFDVRPTWARDLPLASEGGWGRTLMEAEKGVNK